jgi:hypothetical protein
MTAPSNAAITAVARKLAVWDHLPDEWPEYLGDAVLLLNAAADADAGVTPPPRIKRNGEMERTMERNDQT